MRPLTVAVQYNPQPFFGDFIVDLSRSDIIENILLISPEPLNIRHDRCRTFVAETITSQETVSRLFAQVPTEYLLLIAGTQRVGFEPVALERFIEAGKRSPGAMLYTDFFDEVDNGHTVHALNDYQPGSVRDDFDFGPVLFFSVDAVNKTIERYGLVPDTCRAGLYDLRLKISIDNGICHLTEPLYGVRTDQELSQGENHFAYVDPKNQDVQKEMEIVFTDYLKKVGAFLPPGNLRMAERSAALFPVEASIVVPVRNRVGTITDAVRSALSQETDFAFNVIVVDNHSTDGTTGVLDDLSRGDKRLVSIAPLATDLGIGGCWNEAINSKACGRYAVQLDSDDVYRGSDTLQKIVDKLRDGPYAMVVGSYRIVTFDLDEIPPGLIDHREWTDENGHNNALRINGLGAPRAFDTAILRRFGFPNVSYGEDYAVALRICREYHIGRIYESLYLCRRWPGNTDAGLSLEATNRNNAFKDELRTGEIVARQKVLCHG